MNHRARFTSPRSGEVIAIDQLLAEASYDPRMQPRPFGSGMSTESAAMFTALEQALQLRRKMLPAAPRWSELTLGPRRTVVMLDEAAHLLGQLPQDFAIRQLLTAADTEIEGS